MEQFIYLETDFGIFIGIERSDTGLCGSEGFAAKTFFFILIEENMIRHYDLCSVRDHDLRCRNSSLDYFIVFFKKYRNIQSNTISDHACGVVVEYT